MSALDQMLTNVCESDTGRYTANTSPATLYVVRLCVRVRSYMLCILEHVTWSKQPNSGGVSGTRGATYVFEANVIIITFSVWRKICTLRNEKLQTERLV